MSCNKCYTIKIIGLFMLLLTVVSGVSAQNSRTGYFLRGSYHRHEMNPAFMPESNYIAIPGLGNLNIETQGNAGLSNFIFDTTNPMYDMTTFMNSSVGADQFLNELDDITRLNANLNLSILSFGFKKWGGYNTFDLRLRSKTSVNLPIDLFRFMKLGMDKVDGATYHIENLAMRSSNFVEMGFGHSRRLTERLTVGAKFKLLLGAANMDMNIDEMNITMAQNVWTANLKGQANLALNGATFKQKMETDSQGNPTGNQQVDGLDVDSPSIGGVGIGIDLGATYDMTDVVEGLTLSASVLDLGFISWSDNIVADNDGTRQFHFDGFSQIGVDDDSSNKEIDDQVEDLGDDLENMARFYDAGSKSRTTMLGATVHIGAEYELPSYKALHFGLLSTTYFNSPFTWTELRASATIAPLSWFEASTSFATSTLGQSMGLVLNFNPKGFNFFIGTDYAFTKVNSQAIPMNGLNSSISLGMNITFGK
ncbi:MAG: DUF5723 family protein [Bacteroidaceae bacterium]|nr:DUF5723 family protein [Bacteroidaceae bacterium]